MRSYQELGFTLLEVLMALTVFALIAGVSYTALGPAGEGFRQLQEVRDKMEASSWLGKQLRADMRGISRSSLTDLQPIQIRSDARGDTYIDELTLLVREAGRSGLTLVHYKLDEAKGELLRESRMAWSRDTVEPDRIVLAQVSSFHVEIMDKNAQWKQTLAMTTDKNTPFIWPKALRVTVKQDDKQQQWVMLVYQALQ